MKMPCVKTGATVKVYEADTGQYVGWIRCDIHVPAKKGAPIFQFTGFRKVILTGNEIKDSDCDAKITYSNIMTDSRGEQCIPNPESVEFSEEMLMFFTEWETWIKPEHLKIFIPKD
jgi:hypothetical protein